MDIGLSLLWLTVVYVLITLVGILHTIYNWKFLGMESKQGTKPSKVLAYKKTEPYHPLYNIILFPIFSYIYLVQVNPANLYQEALIIAATWTAITIIVDLIGWVLIKHPWYMTFKEMYIDYQPWITLIYISIFVSPFIAAFLI
ncbi:Nitroreductase [Paenibacillus tarimensis]